MCGVDENFDELTNFVKRATRVESAILIQHCGERVRTLCAQLLHKGAKVDLYVQNPAKCVCPSQRPKLEAVHNDLPNHLNEDLKNPNCCLNIYRFDEPATVRAALIPGHILEVGWYIYNQQYINKKQRETDVKGHIRPMIIANHGESRLRS